MMRASDLNRALDGLRVLNLPGRAGDFCGYLLRHWGADVVKVRIVGSAAETDYFAAAYDDGKQIAEIALDEPSGRARLDELVRGVDVVIADSVLTPDAVLSYEQCAALNPTLIYADISTFGRRGPSGGRPGSDLIATAQSGYLHLTGTPGQTPVRMGADQAVKLGGAEAAAAVMVALFHRDRTGCGQHADIAVRDAMIRATVNAIPKYRYEGLVQDRVGDHWGVRDRPLKALWRCRDGWVSFVRRGGILGGRVNQACVEWLAQSGIDTGTLGCVDWDAMDLGNPEHRAKLDELDALFEEFLQTKDTEEVFREGLERGMTLAPVRTLHDVLAEPQFQTRDYWKATQFGGREVRVPRFVVKGSAIEEPVVSASTIGTGVNQDA